MKDRLITGPSLLACDRQGARSQGARGAPHDLRSSFYSQMKKRPSTLPKRRTSPASSPRIRYAVSRLLLNMANYVDATSQILYERNLERFGELVHSATPAMKGARSHAACHTWRRWILNQIQVVDDRARSFSATRRRRRDCRSHRSSRFSRPPPTARFPDGSSSSCSTSKRPGTKATTLSATTPTISTCSPDTSRHTPRIATPHGVTSKTVTGFLRYMRVVRGNSSSSNRRRLASLRRFFGYLLHTGAIEAIRRRPSLGSSTSVSRRRLDPLGGPTLSRSGEIDELSKPRLRDLPPLPLLRLHPLRAPLPYSERLRPRQGDDHLCRAQRGDAEHPALPRLL